MTTERIKAVLKIFEGAGVIATILKFFFGKKLEDEKNEEAVGKYIEKHPEMLERAIISVENNPKAFNEK